jgi:hypothetical protein
MLSKFLPANATLTDRFGHLLFWLFEGMALDWRRRGLRHVHHGEITQRVLGLWKRLRSVIERYQAGTLRPVVSRQSVVSQSSSHARSVERAGWRVLPRRFGWLKSLILPDRQYCVTSFNLLLLDDAEMQAIIAAAPAQIGRVLRPFCHLLGLEVPAELRLPKRRRVRKTGTSPRPSPHSGAGEGRLSPHSGEGEGRLSPHSGEGEARPSSHSGEGEGRRCPHSGEGEAPPPPLVRSAAQPPASAGEGADGAGGGVPRRRRRRTPREVAEDAIRESERTGKPIDPTKIGAVAFGYTLHWPRDGNCPPPEIGYGGRRRRPPKDYRPPKDWE